MVAQASGQGADAGVCVCVWAGCGRSWRRLRFVLECLCACVPAKVEAMDRRDGARESTRYPPGVLPSPPISYLALLYAILCPST
eukprot:2974600-Rhodomonas_salina.2